ncbi:MAG: fimbrillin family protein [Candidatus Symbiothrix sp.]|jgi:uncharacterized protein (TIGR02145 family)|nr:fimbrillin family protein [Candidatus Symbiothrix sp.]
MNRIKNRLSNRLIYSGVVALLLMSSCADENYPMRGNSGKAIGFSAKESVSLRAGVTTAADIADFSVSGWGKKTGVVYADNVVLDEVAVTRTGSGPYAWTYSPLQIWPDEATVDFFAYSPAGSDHVTTGLALGGSSSEANTPAIAYDVPGYTGDPAYTIADQEDLLVAHQSDLSEEDGNVQLTFQHALSYLHFKAKTNLKYSTLRVTGITLKNLKHSGTLNLSDTNLPESGSFDYPKDGANYRVMWTADAGLINYTIDLSSSPVDLPTDNTYSALTSADDGLFVLPQATTFGSFTNPADEFMDAPTYTDPDAFYVSVTFVKVTGGVASTPVTRDFRIRDYYNFNNGLVFEAGKEYPIQLYFYFPDPCPSPFIGDDGNTYSAGVFAGMCWTTQNIKTAGQSATAYNGQTAGERGYYYTWGDAEQACINLGTGWMLPSKQNWTDFQKVLYTLSPEQRVFWNSGAAMAGYYDTGDIAWYYWGGVGCWWAKDTSWLLYYVNSGGATMGSGTYAYFWSTVRCVRSL